MKEIDYNISLPELQEYADEELYQILACAEKDKDEFYRAECTYWMCVMETDRRSDSGWLEYLDVKCLSNLFDKNHNAAFRLGNHYRMYKIENAMLAYSDKWVPHIFSIIEDDSLCAWKYFGLWKGIEDGIGN